MDETAVYLDAPGNRTIDRIGAHRVEIGTTKHEKCRVSVVLCISLDGDKIDALVIHRSATKDSEKINKIEEVEVEYDDDEGNKTMTLYVSYNDTAYMNGEVMLGWIKKVYSPQSQQYITQPQQGYNSHLFLDNCTSHATTDVEGAMDTEKIKAEFFPPNCTPILQPLDHSFNRTFKRGYEDEWRKWYHREGAYRKTKKGNKRKATVHTVHQWIATSLSNITAEHIKKCWEGTLTGKNLVKESQEAEEKRKKEKEQQAEQKKKEEREQQEKRQQDNQTAKATLANIEMEWSRMVR